MWRLADECVVSVDIGTERGRRPDTEPHAQSGIDC